MGRWPATIVVACSMVLGLGAALVTQDETPAASPSAQNTQSTRLRGWVITLVLGGFEDSSSGGPPRFVPPNQYSFTPAETKALADLKGFLPYKTYRPLDTAWVIGLNGPHLFLRGLAGQKHEFYMHATPVNLVNPTVMSVDPLRLWDVAPADPHLAPTILIDTALKIDVGETVVVGTSRLDVERALILLVTAAPMKASGPEGNTGSR
jgi:hypothetical protein